MHRPKPTEHCKIQGFVQNCTKVTPKTKLENYQKNDANHNLFRMERGSAMTYCFL